MRSRPLFGQVLSSVQCTLYRGTLGGHKALPSATDGVLVFWNKKPPGKALVSCQPHQVAWDKVHPTTFSGVLFQMTGGKTAPAVIIMWPTVPPFRASALLAAASTLLSNRAERYGPR